MSDSDTRDALSDFIHFVEFLHPVWAGQTEGYTSSVCLRFEGERPRAPMCVSCETFGDFWKFGFPDGTFAIVPVSNIGYASGRTAPSEADAAPAPKKRGRPPKIRPAE